MSNVYESKRGSYNIVVEYQGKTAEIKVEIVVGLSSITAEKKKTEYYILDKIETDDITVIATYLNGDKIDVTEFSQIDVSKANTDEAGSYVIVVGYENKRAEIKIDVSGASSILSGQEKKKIKIRVSAKRGKKSIKVQTISKTKIKLSCDERIFMKRKKMATISMRSKKSATIMLSKKLKRGMKIKITVSRTGYETRNVTIMVR